jgi:hypothetical protein
MFVFRELADGKRLAIVGDGRWLGMRTAAFLATSGTRLRDLCYISFDNAVSETPFAVVVDHETRAVVVVVRGTFSIKDVVTDLDFIDMPFVFTLC